MYTDRPLVVCAPTGSGKTVIFELAIIRLLMNSGQGTSKAKVVYSKCLESGPYIAGGQRGGGAVAPARKTNFFSNIVFD